jgi:hypothetical protein
MLGLLKLLTIIAASLLFFEALHGIDWTSNVHDPAVLLGVDLLLQGKQDVAALFDRASWYPALSENGIRIEVGLAVVGAILLMAANRLTILEFLGKVILSSIALGLLFLFAGPGRQVLANYAAQIADQAGAATRRSASQAASIGGPAMDGLVIEPGQWSVYGSTSINGSAMPAGSVSRCFSYGKVREIMATGEGLVESSCPVGLERHGNEFRGFSQCGLTEASARIVFDSSVHLTGDLSVTLNGKPWLATHVEGDRTGPC